ncbi:MAG: M20/M25/M40 family metallo-hydrolase [archaeon]|nr:M20/M25/M40 family metallo-hydrolase [archaeon]
MEKKMFDKEKIERLTGKLVSIRTPNPPGNEYRLANYLESELKSRGISYERIETRKKRPSIIAKVGIGKPEILVTSHMDTVSPIPKKEWKTNPYEMVKVGDEIYGLGVADDKGQIASSLLVAHALSKGNFNGTYTLAFTSDEEDTKNTIVDLVESKILRPDFAIIADNASSLEHITIGEMGEIFGRFNVHGRTSHQSMPIKGKAAEALMDILTELKNYNFGVMSHPAFVGEESKPFVNVTYIGAGDEEYGGVIPEKAIATVSIEFLPGENPQKVIEDIRKINKKISAKYDNQIRTRFDYLKPVDIPCVVNPSNQHIANLQNVSKKILNRDVKLKTESGTTSLKPVIHAGIDGVAYGPGSIDVIHRPNEHISLSELHDFSSILYNFVKNQ